MSILLTRASENVVEVTLDVLRRSLHSPLRNLIMTVAANQSDEHLKFEVYSAGSTTIVLIPLNLKHDSY